MTKKDVMKAINQAKLMVSKRSPEILTGVGIAGMLTTVVLSVRATPKAIMLIEDRKDELERNSLTPIETVKATWKCYIPAVLTGTISVSCLIGAQSVNARRTAAIATAYKLSETAFSEYKEKVIETIGEKKEQTVKEKVAQKKLECDPVSKNQIFVCGKGNTLFFDAYTGGYFESDIEIIKKAVNELNRRMLNEMYISLNEFYGEINRPYTDQGNELGWNIDNGFIEPEFSAQIADDGRPCIVINYSVAPRYDYSKLG